MAQHKRFVVATVLLFAVLLAVIDHFIWLRIYFWMSAHTELTRSICEAVWNTVESLEE